MEVAEVKQKIKEWEYAFREKNNRLPSKSDIKENSEIRKLGRRSKWDEEDETETTTVYKRKRTQKRLTKRVKMAPRPVEEKPTLDNINIQKKVSKMEEKEKKHIEAYINSEDEEEEDEVKPRVPEVLSRRRENLQLITSRD
ncbi:hypothetical protein Cantr_03553 [Candida viswanathii]|uniref:DNA replication regulator SLD2 n=1 Tax=Candida viswanathii TaxID=5486 RepID=A0A367YL20_9ASCO|nr:hypothetical protein Cantr_03553 [Candida viswanathii]